MSWFKTRPKVKEPPRALTPHRTSPLAERMMEEAKKTGSLRPKKQPKDK